MKAHDGVARSRQPRQATSTSGSSMASSKKAAHARQDSEREYLYERASQYGEESIKIVRLQKTAEPLVSVAYIWVRCLVKK